MSDRIECLTFFAMLVAGRQTDQFEDGVKLAYHAGASKEDLIAAAEIGRLLAPVPDPVALQANATIHAWQWVAANPFAHRRGLALKAA